MFSRRDFVTAYGLSHYDQTYKQLCDVREKGIPMIWQEYEYFMRSVAETFKEKGYIPPDMTLEMSGTKYSGDDILRYLDVNTAVFHLMAVNYFEQCFQQSTNMDEVIAEYQNGDAGARQFFDFMRFYPVEAMNVLAEFDVPGLMQTRTAGAQIEAILSIKFGQFAAVISKGPLAPPLTDDQVVAHLKDWPQIKKKAFDLNGAAPVVAYN